MDSGEIASQIRTEATMQGPSWGSEGLEQREPGGSGKAGDR